MSLIQQLFGGSLDIIGDVHGEYDALIKLLGKLGYDENGFHPENRKIVFIGDLCDRGPNSPGVIYLVKKLISHGNAQAILGNHELNLLHNSSKDGSGWYFEDRRETDTQYHPFISITQEQKKEIHDFVTSLPIALEREDLRIVHSTWKNEDIHLVRDIPIGQAGDRYGDYEQQIDDAISLSGLLNHYHKEQAKWKKEQTDPTCKTLPFLEYTAQYNVIHQMQNPLRVLTSGIEQRCEKPFFASGKWRFVERFPWWNSYEEDTPVIVGHFWRKIAFSELFDHTEEVDIFNQIEPFSWHGKKNNVFCVDFSVGGRFKERLHEQEIGKITKLAALRWPEKTLVFDTGESIPTTNYKK
jgi:Calcineurin-like phosphoesterase